MFRLKSVLVGSLAASAMIAVVVGSAPASAQNKPPKRSISKVTGDVYRFQNNFRFAMFVVTNDGIVVTDPIKPDAVNWLKGELEQRFNKPVTHMIYSHTHGDHNTGGQAWGSGVTVIAHENAKKNVEAGKADTAVPTETFSDEMVFRIGGKTFELKYLGEGHSDDLIVTVVRPENVAFVVDPVAPNRLPFRNFPRTDIVGLMNQIKVIESLNFKTLVPGHSVVGTKQDATNNRIYIEKLMAEVTAGLKAGKSVDDLVKTVTMDEYKGWGAYGPFRPMNIQGMAAWLKKAGRV